MEKRIVVIGAGGLAREIEWLIRDINAERQTYRFVGFVITDLANPGMHDSHELILGDYNWLIENRDRVDAVALGIGSPMARLRVAKEVLDLVPEIDMPALLHPTALLDRASARIGRGVQICAGVIGTVNLTIEDFVLCNLSCTIGHETTIGRGSVLNPGANLSGGVVIGSGVLVGTGAQILQYLNIGEGGTVGSGAVVTRDVDAGATVVGVPAKPIPVHQR